MVGRPLDRQGVVGAGGKRDRVEARVGDHVHRPARPDSVQAPEDSRPVPALRSREGARRPENETAAAPRSITPAPMLMLPPGTAEPDPDVERQVGVLPPRQPGEVDAPLLLKLAAQQSGWRC